METLGTLSSGRSCNHNDFDVEKIYTESGSLCCNCLRTIVSCHTCHIRTIAANVSHIYRVDEETIDGCWKWENEKWKCLFCVYTEHKQKLKYCSSMADTLKDDILKKLMVDSSWDIQSESWKAGHSITCDIVSNGTLVMSKTMYPKVKQTACAKAKGR